MNHPCNHYSCCENLHGECYGGGCKLNPEPDYDKGNTQDDIQDDTQDDTQEN